MSGKALRSIILFFLVASLAGLFLHAVRLPHDVVAAPAGPAALTFQGGSGDTPATAVIIAGAPDYVAVVAGEYQYLTQKFGRQDRAWQIEQKEVYRHDDQVCDVITIEFPHGAKQQIFFDISKYFKKP
ncbi:MAG: hypothetical protein M0P73_18640 [Syntrophobacterales bacterium]|nr:hypothetical protein [Syntrophobacterales bacterium]